jgi:predicted nucleic acid binding AN1-type Zn finger protein
MQCYECAKAGRSEEAVAICRSCSAGLCLRHVRETAAYGANLTSWASCPHDTWTGSTGEARRRAR